MISYLDANKATCKRCEVVFFYIKSKGRGRCFCDGCLEQNKKEQATAKRARYRQVDRTHNYSGEALTPGALRSYSEVAAVMGLTLETVRRLERSALAKCRRAFRQHLLAKQLDNSLR